MKNNEYSLQLLNHAEVFPTREEAIAYINEEFKNNALFAEPAIVFYGDERKPNMILAVGSGDRKVFLVDTAKLEEGITEIGETTELNAQQIADLEAALKNTIEVCGLIVDENKRENKISYEPDSKDELIGDTTTIAEAVGVISEYLQNKFAEIALTVEKTDSVTLSYEDGVSGGKVLKADVNISQDGDIDELRFNDNILGVKKDGLFVSANLHYDEDKKQLIFTTSGMKNGRFVDDANKQIVELGEHTQYVPDNTDHNVKLTVDSEKNTISADVKLSEDDDNILVVKDGKLFVDGRAINIKYKGTTVFNALKNNEEAIAQVKEDVKIINETHFIEGVTTDTVITSAEKKPLGNFEVKSEVRLGNNHSIILGNGGLEADVEITADKAANTLTVRVGDTEKVIELPGIQVLKDVRYDSVNRVIIISTTDEKTFTIPVGDLISTWDVVNDLNSPIVLTKTVPTDGHSSDTVHATLRLASTNNLLSVDANGALIAPKSYIDDKVADEANRAIAKEEALATQIANMAASAETAHDELKDSIHANADAVVAEETRAKTAETALDNRVTTNEGKVATLESGVADINGQIVNINSDIAEANSNIAAVKLVADTNASDVATLKDDVNTVEDKLIEVKDTLDNHKTSIDNATADITANANAISDLKEKVLQNTNDIAENAEDIEGEIADRKEADNLLRTAIGVNATKIEANSTAIETEKDRATAKEGEILGEVNVAKGAVASEVVRAEAAETALSERIKTNADAITVMNGSADVNGSVAQVVKHTADDLKLLIDNEVEARAAADTALNGRVDALETSSVEGAANALTTAKAYTDAEVEKHVVKTTNDIADAKREAIETAAADATTKTNAALADAKAYTDAETDRAKIAEKANTDAITALQARDVQLTTAINEKVGKVEIKKNNDLQYFLVVDDVTVSEINIPKDQFLKDAVYNNVSKEITFTFVTSEGETTSTINVSDLVDTYTAGNGLSLEDNKFSVKVCAGSEGYLVVGEDGIKIEGIDAAFATKADKADVYTKIEADGKFLTSHQDISALATKAEVNAVNDFVTTVSAKANANEEALATVNANEATEGSIKKSLKDAKDYTDAQLSAEVVRAEAAEQANASAIAIINGNEAQEGSIAKALKDAKSYTDTKVADEATVRETAVNAINDTIATKANSADVYTKAEADAKFLTQHQDISNLAEKSDVEDVAANLAAAEIKIAANKTVIDKLDGNEAVDGSVANAVKVAKDYTDSKFGVVADNIAVINGNEAQEGSIKKALADAKAYTDSKVANKANADDVYTKTEIDAKGYLTEHQDISGLAAKADVTVLQTKVANIEDKDITQDAKIEYLEGKVKSHTLIATETNSIKPILNVTDDGSEIKADVKLATDASNIIKINGNGVYAEVDMEYNKATNTIKFDNGITTKEFALSDQSLLVNGRYDSISHYIILTVLKNTGDTEEINIPVSDLVNDWETVNRPNTPIRLEKTSQVGTTDKLTAWLEVSNHEDNGVLVDNGTLFVSRNAKDLKTSWNNNLTTVQTALDELKAETDKVPALVTDVATLKTDLNTTRYDLAALQGDVTALRTDVNANTDKINLVKGSVDTLGGQFVALQDIVTSLTTRFELLNDNVGQYDARMTAMDNKMNQMNTKMDQINDTFDDINERLANIEETLANLIDFGSYNS